MKIACIGNMNNFMFPLMRYLRDMGHDAHQFVFMDEWDHFLPDTDTYDKEFDQYIHKINLTYYGTIYQKDVRDAFQFLDEFEVAFGNNMVPSYFSMLGKRLDFFVPIGHDIYDLPFYKVNDPFKIKKILDALFGMYFEEFKNEMMSRHQNKGICESQYIFDIPTNPKFDAKFNQLNFSGKRLKYYPPFIYQQQYDPLTISQYYSQSEYYHEFKKIRDENELVLFYHNRHLWKPSSTGYAYKGTDLFFKGAAQFIQSNPSVKTAIITFNYGNDFEETMKLSEHLGITKNIFTFPLMSRKELMLGLSLCDIGIGEMRNSWLQGGTLYEVLCMGKPLMGFRKDMLYEDSFKELYPMINVSDPKAVCEGIGAYLNSKAQHVEMGKRGREWFLEYAIKQPLRKIDQLLQTL